MGIVGLTPEDFKKLPKDGARFESLVCQLLEAMGYRILEKPAVGTEGGRDVLVERTLKDVMGERREKVVVQCKHYAISGKAIGDNDVGVWVNALQRYKARGYLLVTDTRPTENLSRSFREFTTDEANSPKWAAFWDVDELISHLNKFPDLRDSFFPPVSVAVTPLEDLADEVRTWLRAVRYDVSKRQQSRNNIIDMIATLDEGTIKQKVFVRCFGGEIKRAQVDELDELLDREMPQGWLISDKRVSKSAHARASETGGCKVFNLSEFLRQMIWGKYLDALTELVEKDKIPQFYVDLRCYKLEPGKAEHEASHDPRGSLDAQIDEWLTERGKMHISLLGEFGAGKTWFCRHYAYRQLERFLKNPASERLPLLITLRRFAKAMTAQQLINDALLEQYKLPFVGSAHEVFQEMNRRGKILLILDGFDEMARQVDYQTVVDNFWELAKLVEEGSKVILTSRTEYFRLAKESERILGGEEYGRRTIVLEPPKFEVLYIEPFDNEEIRDVIVRRLGEEKGKTIADKVLSNSNLAGMARKPVLIELLLTALDEVSADVLENQAQVYLYATDKLLLRNITARKTFTSTADKLYFLCELAWEMIKSGDLRIHYINIPERIKTYFGDRIKNQHELDMWDFDLRAQTLLHRDAAGYYEFAHKSLAEYFVAFKFAAELGCLAKSFELTYREVNNEPCKLPIKQKDVTLLAQTFGMMSVTNHPLYAVRSFLLEMMNENADIPLLDAINRTSGKTREEVKFVGGNAATLLLEKGYSLSGRQLQGSVLTNINLANADLRWIDLSNANLRESYLRFADLRNADLTRIMADDESLICSDLRGAIGLESNFYRLVTYKIPALHQLIANSYALADVKNLLEDVSVAVIVGESGVGKSTLLANIAQRIWSQAGKNVLWYSGHVTAPMESHYNGHTTTPIESRSALNNDFYAMMATFMTVGGYEQLADLMEQWIDQALASFKKQQSLNPTPNTDFMNRRGLTLAYSNENIHEIGTLLLPAFQKEKWLICIDDIYIQENFEGLLAFFADKRLSTKIIATSTSVPQNLARRVAVMRLSPNDRTTRHVPISIEYPVT